MGGSSAVALIVVALVASTVGAEECDPGICPGSPCAITGVHRLAPGCVLDFSGIDITIAAGAKLVATAPQDIVGIVARSITVNGSISVVAAELFLQAGSVVTAGSGTVKVRRAAFRGSSSSVIRISAYGDVVLGGRLVSVTGDGAYVEVDGTTITVSAPVVARAVSDVALVSMYSLGGAIVTTNRVSARGIGTTARGEIDLISSADLTVGGRLDLRRASIISLSGENVTLDADVAADGVDTRPQFGLSAGRDATIRGDVKVRGRRAGGEVGIGVYGGTLRIEGTIDASYVGTGSPAVGATVTVHAFCDFVLPGAFIAGGAGGSTTLRYAGRFDLTGGTLRAGSGGNRIECRCANPPLCDQGCAEDPIGLGAAALDPPAMIAPVDIPGCLAR